MTPAVAPTATRALTTATMMAVRLLRFARSASDLKVADLEAVNLAAAGRADVRMPLGVAARAEDGGAGTGGIPLAIVASASTGALPISCVSSPCDSRRAASEAMVRGPGPSSCDAGAGSATGLAMIAVWSCALASVEAVVSVSAAVSVAPSSSSLVVPATSCSFRPD